MTLNLVKTKTQAQKRPDLISGLHFFLRKKTILNHQDSFFYLTLIISTLCGTGVEASAIDS